MIKVFIFDLGGVLFTNGTKKFIEDLSRKYNLDLDTVKNIIDGDIGSLYREAKISRDQFWRIVKEKLQINEDNDILENQWINSYELIRGTRDLIFDLSKKYKVYYLSDNVRERVERLNEKYNFLEWFTDGIFSHEVGVRKPNPKIYQYAIRKAQVKAEEAVFIDDKQIALDPAKKMGLLTFLFENPEKLRQQLKQVIAL